MTASADDLALAHELADAADEITLSRFRAHDLAIETKPDMTPVSDADRAAEEAMRERLRSERPGDAIFGEEYGETAAPRDGRRWIVDPIDGTKGYVRGMPIWATLLALEEDGEMTIGVVSAPALGRRWWATAGGGAFVRESGAGATAEPRRLRVSRVRDLADAQFCFGGLEDWRATGRLDAVLELSSRCWRTRGYGDFWQYMLVAEGSAELACDPSVSLWDVAAPMVIVREAGGQFTDLDGVALTGGVSGLASNGLLHDAAREIIGG